MQGKNSFFKEKRKTRIFVWYLVSVGGNLVSLHRYNMNEPLLFNKDIEGKPTAPEVVCKSFCAAMMCVENTFEEGMVTTRHRYPHTQITYIASGRFRFSMGDKVRELGRCDTLSQRNGVMNSCECLEKGVLVGFFTPTREDFA